MLNQRIHKILSSWDDRSFAINFGISIALAILFFHVRYGLGMLNPTETAWLMKYDWAQHYMGWYFYRFEPWTFPLGNMHNLFYPIGTNIGFTDSIPLIAIPLKVISPLLPEQFQYHGPWLFLTHILVAFFSIRILNKMNVRGISQLFALILIVFNPCLMYRALHIALASHWVVVANIWIYFLDPKVISKKKILLYQFLLLIAGGLINPYFAVVNGSFLFILVLKLWFSDRVISFGGAVLYVFGSVLILVASWALTGFFNLSSAGQLGVSNAYGVFSWNTSSLWNPYTYDRHEDWYTHNLSSYLPATKLMGWEQYESFSYLGLGLLILSAIVVCLCILYTPARKAVLSQLKKGYVILLVAFTLAITLFAISNVVSYNDSVVLTFRLPAKTRLFTDIFRASGRYIQVFYYVWFFFLVYVISRTFRKTEYMLATLGIIAIIQFADIRQMIFNRKLEYQPYQVKINEPYWDRIVKSSDKLLFLPPLQSAYLTHDDWRYFSWIAAKNRKPVSVGHIARIDFTASNKFAAEMQDDIAKRKMDSTAVYVTLPGLYSQFTANYFSGKADVIVLDGYLVIAPTNAKDPALAEVFSDIRKDIDQKFIREHYRISVPEVVRTPLKESDPGVTSSIYEITECLKSQSVKGWAFIADGLEHKDDSVRVLLKDNRNTVFQVPARRFGTADVADYFHDPKLGMSGFETVIDTRGLADGNYKVGIEITAYDSGKIRTVQSKWLDFNMPVINPAEPSQVKWSVADTAQVRFDVSPVKPVVDGIIIEGWAFVKDSFKDAVTYVTLSNEETSLAFKATQVERPDVAEFFKDPSRLGTGFMVKIDPRRLKAGLYSVGVLVSDAKASKRFYTLSSRAFHVTSSGKIAARDKEKQIVFPNPQALQQLPEVTGDSRGFIDKVTDKDQYFQVEGWAFVDKVDNIDSRISIVLRADDDIKKVLCRRRARPDLKAALHHTFNTDSSGFEVDLKKDYFRKETYKLSILIEKAGKQSYLPMKDSITF